MAAMHQTSDMGTFLPEYSSAGCNLGHLITEKMLTINTAWLDFQLSELPSTLQRSPLQGAAPKDCTAWHD